MMSGLARGRLAFRAWVLGARADVREEECDALAADDVKVETYWCGEPPKDGECTPSAVPTAAPVKTYSYNFETMQPTLSPTPQATPP